MKSTMESGLQGLKNSVEQKKEEMVHLVADAVRSNKTLGGGWADETKIAYSNPKSPALGFQIQMEPAQISVRDSGSTYIFERHERTGIPTHAILEKGTFMARRELLNKVLDTDLKSMNFDYLPEQYRKDFETKLSGVIQSNNMSGSDGSKSLSACFNVEGMGKAQIDIRNSRFTIICGDVKVGGGLDQDGLAKLSGKVKGKPELDLLKAINQAAGLDGLTFMSPKDMQGHLIREQLSGISKILKDVDGPVWAEFEAKGIGNPENGVMEADSKGYFMDSGHKKIAYEIDQNLNVYMRDMTCRSSSKKDALFLKKDDLGDYEIDTLLSNQKVKEMLEGFLGMLEGKQPMSIRKIQKSSGSGNPFSPFQYPYVVNTDLAQQSEVQEAHQILGLKDL